MRIRAIFAVFWLVIFLTGCGGSMPVPVINKSPNRLIPPQVIVKPGESIYSISWLYGLDYLKIAKWNGLKKPFTLQPGQRLALRQGATTIAAAPSEPVISQPLPAETGAISAKPSAAPQPTNTQPAATPKAAKQAPALSAPSRWQWPADGELIARFSRNSGVNGIRIAGQPGSTISATAAGDVVYVGEGLRGYGKLVIVKHSDKYLSAYAHNRAILVQEGQRIKAGQKIAEMGSSGAERTMLHFEIRVNGKPEDPLKYLKR